MKKSECKHNGCYYCKSKTAVLKPYTLYDGTIIHSCEQCFFSHWLPFYEPDIEEVDYEEV